MDGVYFLANNTAYPWIRPLLCSYRQYNPTLPLCMIPYTDYTDLLLPLAEEFEFTVLDIDYAPYDQLGLQVCRTYRPGHEHMLRKWAAFRPDAPYERFLYLDADIAVLNDVSPLLQALNGWDLLTAHYDTLWDYDEHSTIGFNAGCWIAQRGLLSLENAYQLLPECDIDRLGRAIDQPFFNWCFHRNGKCLIRFEDVTGQYWHWPQQGDEEPLPEGDTWIWRGKRVSGIHWAGYAYKERPWREWHSRLARPSSGKPTPPSIQRVSRSTPPF